LQARFPSMKLTVEIGHPAAGSFDKLRTGSSAVFDAKARQTSLRMTILLGD
jgi:hypothetical protein